MAKRQTHRDTNRKTPQIVPTSTHSDSGLFESTATSRRGGARSTSVTRGFDSLDGPSLMILSNPTGKAHRARSVVYAIQYALWMSGKWSWPLAGRLGMARQLVNRTRIRQARHPAQRVAPAITGHFSSRMRVSFFQNAASENRRPHFLTKAYAGDYDLVPGRQLFEPGATTFKGSRRLAWVRFSASNPGEFD